MRALTAVLDDVTAVLSNRLERLQASSTVEGATESEAAPQTCGNRLVAAQPTAANSDSAQAPHLANEPSQQQSTAPGQKLVFVPVRKRSTRLAAAPPATQQASTAAAGSSYRQVQLPATPPPPNAAQPTPAEKGPRPGAVDQPADTPLAADVLAGLGLGPLASAAADAAENGLPDGTPPLHRQLRSDSEAGWRPNSTDVAVLAPTMEERIDISSAATAEGLLRTSSAAAAAAAGIFAGAGPVERPKAPSAQDGGRKGCNCKRSMCLKMYCECFAAGGYCAPGCACANCYNHQGEAVAVEQARQIVLAKDPQAFEKKVTAAEGHKKGCRCKRSKCLKKYCECYHAGAKCNPDVCQCEGCRNTEAPGAATAAVLTSSPSLDADSLVNVTQAPSVLHALASILPPLQRQDTPEISLLADSMSVDNLASAVPPAALAPARQASRPLGGRAAPQQQQQQVATGAAGSRLLASPTPLAFAGFPLATFQQASDNGTPALSTPFLVPGLFAGMPPFVFNPVPATLASQPQLPPIQQLLLPIAPLHTAVGAAAQAAEQELLASQGDEAPLLAAAANAEAVLVASLGKHALTADAAQQELLLLRLPAAPAAAAEGPGSAMAAEAAASGATGATSPARELQGVEQPQGSVALTAHLSEVLGALDPDIRDTATSPAPNVAVSRLPAAPPAATTTLNGRGSRSLKGPKAQRPPAPRSRAPSEERSVGSSLASQNGAGSTNNISGAESSQLGKRPRRAASGGVQGAVAAEAAAWGEEWDSPPKRAASIPALGGSHRSKAAGRFALLKKALEAETMHAQKRARGCIPMLAGPEARNMAADEEDVISALFELSSSAC